MQHPASRGPVCSAAHCVMIYARTPEIFIGVKHWRKTEMCRDALQSAIRRKDFGRTGQIAASKACFVANRQQNGWLSSTVGVATERRNGVEQQN